MKKIIYVVAICMLFAGCEKYDSEKVSQVIIPAKVSHCSGAK